MYPSHLKLLSIAIVALFPLVVPASGQQTPEAEGRASALEPRAATDRLKLLYRVAGVTDFGAANAGVATSFHCSNFSNVTESVAVQVRDHSGAIRGAARTNFASFNTVTFSTHQSFMFADDVVLNSNGVSQGLGIIWGTSDKIICSAMVHEASSNNAVALHMVRFNALPGTQE